MILVRGWSCRASTTRAKEGGQGHSQSAFFCSSASKPASPFFLGNLAQQLVENGFARVEVKNTMLKALGLQDRSIESSGSERAVIRVYSCSILRKDTSIIEYATGKRENLVQGWNVHEIQISRPMALAILHPIC